MDKINNTENIKENIDQIRKKIDLIKEKNKITNQISLIAVTKKANPNQIIKAIESGIEIIGENKIQDAIEKFKILSKHPSWSKIEKHFIGHLQTNKVKLAVTHFDCIQSVDSLKLAKEINKWGINQNKIVKIMIEINVSGEDTKFGIDPNEVFDFNSKILRLSNTKVIGIMTIAPYTGPENTQIYFRKIKELNKILNLKYLSMGMTNDFEIAISEGSNMIRIGTAIFSN